MKKTSFWMMVSVAAGIAVLLSCGKSGNYVTGPSGSNPTITQTGTYMISGDSIYLAIIKPSDTMRYCNGNSLVVGQINPADTQSELGVPYSIANNTLTITVPFDTVAGQVALIETFTRSGFGTGVQGTWNVTSVGYQVLYGTLPDNTKHFLDSMVTAINQSITSGERSLQFTFSGAQFTEVISSTEMSSTSYGVDYYVSSWTTCSQGGYGLDTCTYAVIVVKLNNSMVQLHGKTSGETVTISFNAADDETYTSSDTAHHAGIYYANPVSCPNSPPDWFATFLAANAKTGTPLYKKSAPQMIQNKPPLTKWLRVF